MTSEELKEMKRLVAQAKYYADLASGSASFADSKAELARQSAEQAEASASFCKTEFRNCLMAVEEIKKLKGRVR